MNYATGELTMNNESRSVGILLLLMDWVDLRTDQNKIIIRYPDVLLIYAEAKIDLNEIDESVLVLSMQ